MSASEFIIVAAIVIVGLIFLVVGQRFIFGSQEETMQYSNQADAEGIISLINRVVSEPASHVSYSQYVSLSNITIKDGILTYESGGSKYSFQVPKNVSNVYLEETTSICVIKIDEKITVSEECPKCNLDTFCTPDECKENCPDCLGPKKICVGDGFCNLNIGENCESSPSDCKCDSGKICCPISPGSDSHGCSLTNDLKKKGEQCWCDNQCDSGLKCNPTTSAFKDYRKACCEGDKKWNGTDCIDEICPPTISQCINHWHWDNYDGTFSMNINGEVCDYFEVCHPTILPIITEIIKCCDNKCSGNCHSKCNQALSDSGLSSTDTTETRKKCYGLYAVYGLDGAAKWMQGYQIHLEEPASIMLTGQTWMCTGYSIALTTLLRSVGYDKTEAYSVVTGDHAFNLVKLPGETNYRFMDTVGNGLYISGITSSDWYKDQHNECRTSSLGNGCMNDEGTFTCPSSSNIILGASC
jgi:hypothetical protein